MAAAEWRWHLPSSLRWPPCSATHGSALLCEHDAVRRTARLSQSSRESASLTPLTLLRLTQRPELNTSIHNTAPNTLPQSGDLYEGPTAGRCSWTAAKLNQSMTTIDRTAKLLTGHISCIWEQEMWTGIRTLAHGHTAESNKAITLDSILFPVSSSLSLWFAACLSAACHVLQLISLLFDWMHTGQNLHPKSLILSANVEQDNKKQLDLSPDWMEETDGGMTGHKWEWSVVKVMFLLSNLSLSLTLAH